MLSNNHGLLLVKGQGSDIHFSDTVTYSGYDSYLSCIFNFVEVRSCWQHLYSDILEANFHILFVFHSIFVVAHFIPPFFAHIFIFVVFPSLKFTFPSLYSFFQLSRLMGFFDHLNFAVFRTHDHYHMYIPFLNQIALPILNSFLFVSLLLLSFFKIMLLQILKVRL